MNSLIPYENGFPTQSIIGKYDLKIRNTLIKQLRPGDLFVNTTWIEDKLTEMKSVLNSDIIPEIEKNCEKCAYIKGGKEF